jgi:hypothetical protein
MMTTAGLAGTAVLFEHTGHIGLVAGARDAE